ncbi:MAG: VOC family protein [Caldilineaceae bacterium]
MTIDPQTKLGPVHLQVADLNTLVAYYTTLGLHLRGRNGKQAVLGAGEQDLLVLKERADGQRVRGSSGLYHFAILLPSRTDLGRALRHFSQSAIPVGGASDHAVSEALYLTDPEGNGIEIYRDRPRAEWQYPNGELVINTTPFDAEGVLAAGNDDPTEWNGFPAATVIGHIHLHVGSIDDTEGFYRDALGFDLITRYGPSATFLSAGGYHHHIGANTWAGVGAPPAPENAWGLSHFTIEVPGTQALSQVRARLESAGVSVAERDNGYFVRDPSGNGILLRSTT